MKLSEPAYRTKAWVWRRHLANPNFPSDMAQWASALHQWESELREFERQFKTVFTEDEKVSIIAHVAPKELQQSIFTHSDALNTYAKIRDYIEQYLINKNLWKRPQGSTFGLTRAANKVADDQGPAPMDIGAEKEKETKARISMARKEKEKIPGTATRGRSKMRKEKEEKAKQMERAKEKVTKGKERTKESPTEKEKEMWLIPMQASNAAIVGSLVT